MQKSRLTVKVSCKNCEKQFSKALHHVKQNRKLGHDFFCSKNCFARFRTRGTFLVCENIACKKSFYRMASHVSVSNYCSRTCAAIVNNRKYPKWPPRKCAYCEKHHNRPDSLYCSVACGKSARLPYTKDELIELIQAKYKELGRVPAKREVQGLSDKCTHLFGSWNNAVTAAGLAANRSHDNRMYKRLRGRANDGHICDSISEILIDNWLARHNIPHMRDASYPNTKHKADWSIGDNTFIEYFGLAKDSLRYDRDAKKKMALCQKNKIKLIGVYPHDLYPTNRLGEKFRQIVTS